MRYLTPSQVAKEVQLNYRTVLAEIARGNLRASRPAGRLRIRSEDVDAWLKSTEVRVRRATRCASLHERNRAEERLHEEIHAGWLRA